MKDVREILTLWPQERPQGCVDNYFEEFQYGFAKLLENEVRLTLDLAIWQIGYSATVTKFIVDQLRHSLIFCSDTVTSIRNQYLYSIWEHRHRVLPLIASVQDAGKHLKSFDIIPEIVVFDITRCIYDDQRCLLEEIEFVHSVFPKTTIIGGGLGFESVSEVVDGYVKLNPLYSLQTIHDGWKLVRSVTDDSRLN